MTTITEHGIVLGANDKPDIPIFDGEDATKVAPFKLALAVYLNSKGVSLPYSNDDPLWMATHQILYTVKATSRHIVDQAMLNANAWMRDMGMVVGDLSLTSKERQIYEKDLHANECLKQMAANTFKKHIAPGSIADLVITRGADMRDFRVMYFDWIEHYEGLRLHNVIAHAQRYVEGFGEVPKTGMHQLDHLTKIESEYLKLMQVEKKKEVRGCHPVYLIILVVRKGEAYFFVLLTNTKTKSSTEL